MADDAPLEDEPFDDHPVPDATWVSCPYCGEGVELILDPGGGSMQEYVEDCEVCCRPWMVRVAVGVDGDASVTLTTLDE